MKKLNLLYLAAFALFFTSCSKEGNDVLTEKVNHTIETAIDSPNYFAKASFDNKSEGLYHGVFSTRDFSKKGDIYINIANNGNYNAILTLLDGTKIEMTLAGNQLVPDMTNLKFISTAAVISNNVSFILDASDYENLVATNVQIGVKDAYIVARKEKSYGKIAIALGTYVDDLDPTYTGNWDIFSGPETVDSSFGNFERINMVTASNPAGFEVDDTNTTYETFDMSNCTLVAGDDNVEAFYDETKAVLIARNQVTEFAAYTLNWSCNYSSGEYTDNNCSPSLGGSWSRSDGRFGTFTLN